MILKITFIIINIKNDNEPTTLIRAVGRGLSIILTDIKELRYNARTIPTITLLDTSKPEALKAYAIITEIIIAKPNNT